MLRPHHMFSGPLPDVVQRHDLVTLTDWNWWGRRDGRRSRGWSRRRRRGGLCRNRRRRRRRWGRRCTAGGSRLDDLLDIGTGDAATEAGAGNVGDIESVVGDEAANHRRQDQPVRGWRSRLRCDRRRFRGRRWWRWRRWRCCRDRLGWRRRRWLRCGLGRGCGFRCRSSPRITDSGKDLPDLNHVTFGGEDLGEDTGDRGRHLRVDLVGRDLKEDLVHCDGVADVLEPLRDGSFREGLPQLGHGHISH